MVEDERTGRDRMDPWSVLVSSSGKMCVYILNGEDLRNVVELIVLVVLVEVALISVFNKKSFKLHLRGADHFLSQDPSVP